MAKSGTIYYSYYLAYACAALESSGHDVRLIDSIVSKQDFDSAVSQIKNEDPELVVVDTSTPSINSDIAFCGQIKRELPNATVVVTGTFPSKAPEELSKILSVYDTPPIDGWCTGEYELSLVDFCNAGATLLEEKVPQGFGRFRNGIVELGVPARMATSEDLDSFGFVSDVYKRHFGRPGIEAHFYASIKWPYIQILGARGCPYKCSFCNIPSIGSYRPRSVNSVLDELEFIERYMPYVKEVFFEDDTFDINSKRTLEFCEGYKQRGLTITWSCNGRVNSKKETLEAMKKANCRLICVGFESPTKEGLDGVVKKTNNKLQETFMENAKSVGLKVNGCFILGLPGDDYEQMYDTMEYSKKLMPNTAQFYPHMLYPGTQSFKWAEESGIIAHKDWDRWLTKDGYHNTPLVQNGIASDELLRLCDIARQRFYLNPHYIWKMVVQSLTDVGEFKRMMIAGRTFFPILVKSLFSKS